MTSKTVFSVVRRFASGIIFLVLAAPAACLGQQSAVAAKGSSGAAESSHRDSALAEHESVPPLRLHPSYAEPRITPRSSLLLPRTGSWLSEPEPRYAPPPSLSLYFESPLTGPEPAGTKERWLLETRANLVSPLELDWQSGRGARLWRSIFRAVEAGGVGYLLYLHIKKYGLK